jgi:hypothetical protein
MSFHPGKPFPALRRQCGATTRAGTPCNRPPIPGGNRCTFHGGATPAAREAAAERLAAAAVPAATVLHDAMRVWNELLETYRTTSCPTCGRSASDVKPVLDAMSPVIRAAQVVLDRTGFHPSLSLHLGKPDAAKREPWFDYATTEELQEVADLVARVQAAATARMEQGGEVWDGGRGEQRPDRHPFFNERPWDQAEVIDIEEVELEVPEAADADRKVS